MTCGVEFSVKAVTVPGTEEAVEFHCFDTAGQDVYEEMMPQFWEGAKAVVLVYDVTRAFTLEACGHWYGRLLEALGGLESLPGVLVANKVDLRERTVVNRQQGQAMAESLRMPVRACCGTVCQRRRRSRVVPPCARAVASHCVPACHARSILRRRLSRASSATHRSSSLPRCSTAVEASES